VCFEVKATGADVSCSQVHHTSLPQAVQLEPCGTGYGESLLSASFVRYHLRHHSNIGRLLFRVFLPLQGQ
jgi:hypothetical protein